MDSGGNSGSLQSSSGGDEEYDSRAAASVFMNHPPDAAISAPLFDPISNYMQILHQNPSPSFGLNPNMAWPRPAPQRSDPNTLLSAESPDFQPPPNIGNPVAGQNSHQAAPRNPKKRSRASRRAPTTVLTTDTANFRAMVQEFTGIPSPPFNSSPFPRGRFEIFGARSGGHPLSPPYLRRPFPQKVQSPPPFIDSGCNPSNSTDQFNFPNPLLNYSLLLQSNPKFLFSNSPIPPSKPNPSNSFEIPPVGLDEFGLSGDHHVTSSSLTALPNLVSGDQIGSVHHDAGTTNADIRPINGSGCSFPNGRMNLKETSSDGRRPENVGNREDGPEKRHEEAPQLHLWKPLNIP